MRKQTKESAGDRAGDAWVRGPPGAGGEAATCVPDLDIPRPRGLDKLWGRALCLERALHVVGGGGKLA